MSTTSNNNNNNSTPSLGHSTSVEETIFENQILKSPSSNSNSSDDTHHHIHEYLSMPSKRVRTLSDIEGEWCPKEGDIVSFKKALMPPKMQKYQAVHVHFVHLKEGVKHEHWDNTHPNM